MLTNPLVSILVPVYNVEKYIREALTSLLVQTYSNIEIIVIDDCSTDNTFSEVCKLAVEDNRIKPFKNSKNVKIAKTLNRAFSLASGDYILRMDGDDISSHDRLEVKLNFLLDNSNIDIVGCSTCTISEDGLILSKVKSVGDEKALINLLKYTTPLKHIWLARRRVYETLGGYRNIPGVEDYDFLLRANYNGFRFTNIEDYFGYKVRIGREGSTISTLGYKQLELKRLVYLDYRSSYNGKFATINFKVNKFWELLYSVAAKRLSAAISCRAKGNYFSFVLNLHFCFLSPHMVSYLYERVFLRYYFWRNRL